MAEKIAVFQAEAEDKGLRSDVRLAEWSGESRSSIQALFADGKVVKLPAGVKAEEEYNELPAGKILKANYKLKNGDILCMELPPVQDETPVAEDIPLDIIYEDDDLMVINKARGMVVHPAPGHSGGTLVNALLHHTDSLSDIGGDFRPGIVHRLDKDTSGVMLVAKNNKAHEILAKQIQSKTAKRSYIAVVEGNVPEEEGVIDTLIARDSVERKRMAVVTENGRRAVTGFKVLKRYGSYTVVQCDLQTGRTHQIRVHMSHIGHPVVGDLRYGAVKRKKPVFSIEGQALHSYKLSFMHPVTGEELNFTAEFPEELQKIFNRLENGQF